MFTGLPKGVLLGMNYTGVLKHLDAIAWVFLLKQSI